MTIKCPCCEQMITISVFAHTTEKKTELNAFEIIDSIQRLTADVCVIDINRLKAKERNTFVVLVRQIVMYLVRKYFSDKVTLPYLGEFFNRDHTTVMHAVQTITDMVEVWESMMPENIRWRVEMLQKSEAALLEKFPSTETLRQAV
jgi:chromosomal replication initiation ATPase DnaA